MKKLPPMHLACGTDMYLPQLSLIQIKGGIATATNAYIVVRYDLKDYIDKPILDTLENKCIHLNTWKFLLSNYVFLRLIGDEVVLLHPDFGAIKLKTIEDKFVDYKQLFVDSFDDSKKAEISTIGINTQYINIISKILSHEAKNNNIAMNFRGENRGIACVNVDNRNAVAIVMPKMNYEYSGTNYSHLIL